MKEMSEIIKDELVKPMDRAIWNVEHVIKFSKSKHLLRYYGHDISLINYYGTIAILILPFILIIYCVYSLRNYLRSRKGYNCMKDRIKFYVKSKFE